MRELAAGFVARAAAAEAEVAQLKEAEKNIRAFLPNDLRLDGWAVAVHNDYRQNGQRHTFWLLTKDGRCIKGEGRDDADALDQCRAALASENEPCQIEH